VTNGMSQYSRNERNANAGMVVGIDPSDYPADAAAVRGAPGRQLRRVEALGAGHPPAVRHRAAAPARIAMPTCSAAATTARRASWWATSSRASPRASWAREPSYKPGVRLGDLRTALPGYAIEALREALPAFGRKIKGFDRTTRC
jgi:uncharacterized FAD-dependent dehydrogenase